MELLSIKVARYTNLRLRSVPSKSCCILCSLLFAFLAGTATAEPALADIDHEDTNEYEIKAAFLYSFLHYVEWPETSFSDDSSPIILGVLGKDPFGPILDRMAETEKINNRELVIKRFEHIDAVGSIHALFIASSKQERLSDVLKGLGDRPVLTAGDTEEFAALGVIINFIIDQKKIRFEINTGAVKKADLKISSKLLKLAKKIFKKAKEAKG